MNEALPDVPEVRVVGLPQLTSGFDLVDRLDLQMHLKVHGPLEPLGGEQLAQLADALQQNTTLETLDVSRNPCCGTDLAGIAALRVALAIHPRLRRVFLAGTHMMADGAIALAREQLPAVAEQAGFRGFYLLTDAATRA